MKKTLILFLLLLRIFSLKAQDLTVIDGSNSITILPTSVKAKRTPLISNEITAIGTGALGGNHLGLYNTAIGFNAGFNSSGSGNVYIGYNAGHSSPRNNKLVIKGKESAYGLILGDFVTQRVGINFEDPISTLHVNSFSTSSTLGLTNSVTDIGAGVIVSLIDHDASIINKEDAGILSLGARGRGFVHLSPNGKIGINTASPVGNLDIFSPSETPTYSTLRLANTNNAAAGFYLKSLNADGYIMNLTAGGNIYFRTEDVSRIAILNNGNVGIGTNDASNKLEIYHNSSLSTAHLLLDEIGYDYARLRFKNTTSLGTDKFWDIAATLAGASGEFFGDHINFYLHGRGDIFQIRGDGSACLNGNLVTTGTACTSDIRYKKNFSNLNNSLDKISQMNGLYYFWKTDEFKEKGFKEDRQIGFIAQEVEKTFPELVTTDNKGYKSVDYARLTPVLVEAIKELKSKNDLLEQKLNRIEQLLSSNTLKAEN